MQLLLIGNPNNGKTTLFNRLSGGRAKVANYPGVTVEKRSASVDLSERWTVEIVDLPGTYSLLSRSPDEWVTQREVLQACAAAAVGDDASRLAAHSHAAGDSRPATKPEPAMNLKPGNSKPGNSQPGEGREVMPYVACVVLDATAMARSMYLALQVRELGLPTIFAVTMLDEARAQGMTVDLRMIASRFCCPVVDVSAHRGRRRETVKQVLSEALRDVQDAALSDAASGPRPDGLVWAASYPKGLYDLLAAEEAAEARASALAEGWSPTSASPAPARLGSPADCVEQTDPSVKSRMLDEGEVAGPSDLTGGGAANDARDSLRDAGDSLRDARDPLTDAAFEEERPSHAALGFEAALEAAPEVHLAFAGPPRDDTRPTSLGWRLLEVQANRMRRSEAQPPPDRRSSAAAPSEAAAPSRMPGPQPDHGASGDESAQEDFDLVLISARYRWIDELLRNALGQGSHAAPHPSQAWDRWLLHPWIGSAAFLITMAILFQLLFVVADPMIALIEYGVGLAQQLLGRALPDGFVHDLLVEGILAGVGNVVVFLPQIALLFLALGILEDSGYLARVAFVIDRLMAKVGLNGTAFVPFLSGFACAVPAIASTRTLSHRRDRLVAMLAIPLTACSARLPVFVLVSAVIFSGEDRVLGILHPGGLALLLMYAISTASALLAAALLRRTVLRGPAPAFVLNIPPYRLPRLATLFRSTSTKSMTFLREAGTVILGFTIVLWALLSYPKADVHPTTVPPSGGASPAALHDPIRNGDGLVHVEREQAELESTESEARGHVVDTHGPLAQSYGGQLGRLIEPLIAPLGFDWRIGVALIGAFSAREVFVSTLGILFGQNDADEHNASLRESLQHAKKANGDPLFDFATGISLMVFFLFACQCISTLAAVWRESESWRWPLLLFTYMTVLAYTASWVTYQGISLASGGA